MGSEFRDWSQVGERESQLIGSLGKWRGMFRSELEWLSVKGGCFDAHALTEFILGETVELNPFGKFVCLTTYQDRNRVLFGHHCHQCCPCPGEHGTVRMERVCTDQHQIDLGDDGSDRGK